MTELRDINITSVNLVKEELTTSVDTAASHLDQYAVDRANLRSLEQCIGLLQQVCGVLQMVQLPAADLLGQEMISALADIQEGRQEPTDDVMESLSIGFYVLTRYLDFVQHRGFSRPELLIPYINNLRSARSMASVPESHFFDCRVDASVPGAVSSSVMSEDLGHFVRRFRHMYQVGLLALLKGKPAKPAFTMMSRALQRVASISAGRPSGKLWALAGAALGGMASKEMHTNRSRVMAFSMLDRSLRNLQKEGDAALDKPAPPMLVKECLYWLALSSPSGAQARILEAFSVKPLGYSEAELERERASLGGPGATAISAVASALDEELSTVRRMLDSAETIDPSETEEEEGLLATLRRIASALALLNFRRVAESLRSAIEEYHSSAGAAAEESLQKLTSQVLVVDSVIQGLRQSSCIDVDEHGHADMVFERSQLAEAELTVLKEAEAGLSLIKRALGSYAESDFDHGHIRNVSTTLNSVRGGLVVLSLSRAAAIVERLAVFVDSVMNQRDTAPAIEQALDTFADAIISIEYYLGEVKLNRKADTQSLDLALESLEALGYPVELA
ncbi:hypothetical protein [Microbulbifer aestuariivivens]|uniref:hypothetical protein n=1 Tax=Microbulbifer aestuariivivens TaxID=1908308 RepID=UPI0031E8ECF6